ncbi:hypothetical protein EJD97_006867, partial [Solanum chilense]
MFNDEFHLADMNKPDDEIGIGEFEVEVEGVGEAQAEGPYLESKFPPTPIVGSNNPCASQTSRVSNVRDDETDFYKGMTFTKKKKRTGKFIVNCLLEKRFLTKKVINSRNVFSFKCSYPDTNWWPRAVKFT